MRCHHGDVEGAREGVMAMCVLYVVAWRRAGTVEVVTLAVVVVHSLGDWLSLHAGDRTRQGTRLVINRCATTPPDRPRSQDTACETVAAFCDAKYIYTRRLYDSWALVLCGSAPVRDGTSALETKREAAITYFPFGNGAIAYTSISASISIRYLCGTYTFPARSISLYDFGG